MWVWTYWVIRGGDGCLFLCLCIWYERVFAVSVDACGGVKADCQECCLSKHCLVLAMYVKEAAEHVPTPVYPIHGV